MAVAIDVDELRERPAHFVPHLNGAEKVQAVEVLQAHHERAVLKLTNSAGATRFLKLDSSESRHRHEVSGLGHLASKAMAPEVVFSNPNRDGLAVLVLAEAHGQPLSTRSSQTDWAAAARSLVDMNVIEVNTVGDTGVGNWSAYLAGLAEYADGSDLVSRAIGGSIQSIVDDLAGFEPGSAGLGFIHGDAQPGHFFVDGGRIQAIDLADWTVGDIAFDLAVLTLDETNRLDDLVLILDPSNRRQVVARVKLYWMLRLATEIRWFDEHDFDPTQLLDRLGSMTSGRRQPR